MDDNTYSVDYTGKPLHAFQHSGTLQNSGTGGLHGTPCTEIWKHYGLHNNSGKLDFSYAVCRHCFKKIELCERHYDLWVHLAIKHPCQFDTIEHLPDWAYDSPHRQPTTANWAHHGVNYNAGHSANFHHYEQVPYLYGRPQRQPVYGQTNYPYTMQQNTNAYFSQVGRYGNNYPYPMWNPAYFNYPRYPGTWPINHNMESYNSTYNHQLKRKSYSETMSNNIMKYNMQNKDCNFSRQVKPPWLGRKEYPPVVHQKSAREPYSCKDMDIYLNSQRGILDSQQVAWGHESTSTETPGTTSPSSQDSGSWDSALLPCKSWGIGGGGSHAEDKSGSTPDTNLKKGTMPSIENCKTSGVLEDLDLIAQELLIPNSHRNTHGQYVSNSNQKRRGQGKKTGKDLSFVGSGGTSEQASDMDAKYNQELDEAISSIMKMQDELE